MSADTLALTTFGLWTFRDPVDLSIVVTVVDITAITVIVED